MQKESHNPQRTCVGCMQRDAQASMIRLAAGGAAVVADFDGKMIGRGAYLHPNNECFDRFVKSKVKEFKSLKRRIERPGRVEIVAAIRAWLDSQAAVQ